MNSRHRTILGALCAGALMFSGCTHTSESWQYEHIMSKSTIPMIEKAEFGKTPEGESVQIFTLVNRNGLKAKITNYGGIVTELHVPDRQGRPGKPMEDSTTISISVPYTGMLVHKPPNSPRSRVCRRS